VIGRLPRCLHTCLHCKHAVILEEYSRYSRRLVYDGCWKNDTITLPVNRETCGKFEESTERVQRKFWKKWEWKVYCNGNLVTLEQPESREPGEENNEQAAQGSDKSLSLFNQESNCCETVNECTESKSPNHTIERVATERNTTRSLILQALANRISRLKDIAHFAEVDPSTAHYHLRNLIREQRVIKLSWGQYVFTDTASLKGKNFEKLLKNSSQSQMAEIQSTELNPVEKNILVDILSKDNRYEWFSERELARRNSISRYKVKKYTHKLEKNKLITIERVGKQLLFMPTEVAIKGFSSFLDSEKIGSKIDSSSSKIQPINEPVNPEFQPNQNEASGFRPDNVNISSDGNQPDQPDNPSESDTNVLETFDEYLTWQQKNAHRLFIQFKLLRGNHNRLKGTGWIFGKKSIHKHFAEAYIFKSKDPEGEFVNVLPNHPIIFETPFEFHDQIITFVNDIIDRLHAYGIVIDLSEPAQVRLAHEALEDDPFARKVIEKGLLYFKSKVITVDSTGETMEYVIAIDKSKKLHLEIEGREAHHLMENYEEFMDDVVTKRIDPKFLRGLPRENKELKEKIERIQDNQITFAESLHQFSETVQFYSENIRTHIDTLTSLTRSVDQSIEASKRIEKAAVAVEKAAEVLTEAIGLLKTRENIKGFFEFNEGTK
jgi:DNA-binding MarR family transcriptional regulator